ncbi:MAG TPA: hypothetical protein VE981_15750 [Planctomycetota bacterium]|nr:hypothetical protein [Planctomycetota bacterium]
MRSALRVLPLLILLPAMRPQDPGTSRVRERIDRLEAERREARDRATAELKKLGAAAVPELEKAERDSNPERASRAKSILRVIRLRATFSTAFLAAFPDADDRLAGGQDGEWTRVFLNAAA